MDEIGSGSSAKVMGSAHSNAYRQIAASSTWIPPPGWPPSAAATKLASAKRRTLWAGSLTRPITQAVARDDIGLVDVVTPEIRA